METYSIIDLLTFLKGQQMNEYRGIEAIFEIIEDRRIPEEEKIAIVLSILRQLGLHEQLTEECFDIERSIDDPIKQFIPFRMDRLEVPILNTSVMIDTILN